ncbi:MAG TPA: hypothetical protein VGN24_09275 [Rhodanobacter sp.]|jgi:hypothetical protein|nr:hypothetical protein [Rhodanobacter sp.]
MRYVLLAMLVLLYPAISTQAQAQSQLGVSIGTRGVSLGFSMSTYPTLVPIPGYPVYYDPQVDENYFFYDGLYWVYGDDSWYSSPWYNGPWDPVSPAYVPLFVLRVPVRYYRRPPSYFRGWRSDDAPRWGQHWGSNWERQRSGWDQWDRHSVPRAAPLPTYQRNYTGSRYPRQVSQQRSIASRNYRYQPQEAASRRIHEERGRAVPARSQQQNNRQQNDRRQQEQVKARQQDVQKQKLQQQQVQHQRDVQQQQRNVRQEQSVQQQQQHARQQERAQQQQSRQQQAVQQQQRARQQEVQQQRSRQPEVQQQRPRPQHAVQQEQRARPQPPQNARGADNKGGNGRAAEHGNQKDNKKDQKDNHKDDGGHQ